MNYRGLGFMVVFNFADSGKYILTSHSSLINKKNKCPKTIPLLVQGAPYKVKEINLTTRGVSEIKI